MESPTTCLPCLSSRVGLLCWVGGVASWADDDDASDPGSEQLMAEPQPEGAPLSLVGTHPPLPAGRRTRELPPPSELRTDSRLDMALEPHELSPLLKNLDLAPEAAEERS